MLRTRAIHVALGLLLAACGATTPTHLQAADDHPPSPQVEHTLHQWQPTTTAAPTTTTTAAPPPPTTSTTQAPPVAPRVVASAAAPATGYGGDCSGWRDLVAAHFPADQLGTACRVLACESGGNFQAENASSSASGGWQFLASTWESVTGTPAPASAYSPDVQTAAAARLWARSGWGQWSCA